MKYFITLLFIISISFAQQTWTRTYGGTNYDWGYSVQQTSDGGYIVAGCTQPFFRTLPEDWLGNIRER